MRFLLDSLEDIDRQLQSETDGGGRLVICQGQPVEIFRRLNEKVRLHKICVEQDCEPIWNERDESVKQLCVELGIKFVEKISHTLWNPRTVIETNGGIAPLTYQMFLVSFHLFVHFNDIPQLSSAAAHCANCWAASASCA